MEVAKELKKIFDPQQILDDSSSLKEFGKDWTKYFEPRPSAIFFPKSTEDVVKMVKWARENKIALVPSGGRTGLSGGAVALNGEVVVSLQKMNRILEFDSFDQTVTLEAGVVTETLQKYAEEKGLYFPVDFASRGSSHVGGNIATNAGGIKVLRFGLMRNWVAGLEVVTGAGEVLHLNNSLVKNATGYDLRQLIIGSEGTLGIVTRATIALTRPTAEPILFVFGVSKLDSVMKIFHSFKSSTPVLAFEMFTDLALKYVLKHHTQLNKPFAGSYPYYLICELENTGETVEARALELFEKGMDEGWIEDGIQAQGPQQMRDLWRLREDVSESTAPYMPYKNDISVRVAQVPEFLTKMDHILKTEYPDFESVWFGHIGDGNLHINILKPENMPKDEFLKRCKTVDEKMFAMIEGFKGSISAEHGVGLTKKPYLSHSRSSSEIQLMKQIKKVFDPDGIMNPGKIFDV
jgi:FAD/FMN-containing dehydrogenase